MRSAYKLALIVLLAFAANVAISHVSDTSLIDSSVTVSMDADTVVLWCAPASHPVALAVAVSVPVLTSTQDTPVTDTGGSAVAGAPLRGQSYDTDRVVDILKAPYRAFRLEPKPRTYNATNHPVTDLVT